MDRSSRGCPEHLIEFLASRLTPGSVDPHVLFDCLDWHDFRSIEVAIAHTYPAYVDQSWATTIAEQWIASATDDDVAALA